MKGEGKRRTLFIVNLGKPDRTSRVIISAVSEGKDFSE